MNFEFSGQIFEKDSSDFMKIPPVGAEFHAGRRTDMTKLMVAFLNFANAAKNSALACIVFIVLFVAIPTINIDCFPKEH
jgi:hypothetical protein